MDILNKVQANKGKNTVPNVKDLLFEHVKVGIYSSLVNIVPTELTI